MIALQPNNKDTIERNCGASINSLQNVVYPYNMHYYGGYVEGFPELKHSNYAQPQRDVMKPEGSLLSSNPSETPKESHGKPTQFSGFSLGPVFYPDFSTAQLYQLNAFESQVYPYSLDNRFQHAPSIMLPRNIPYEYQFQDFQYFVVIDFEATCDKEKNPHPQEIIEFPSVIVSSTTGQLEACFQTYVRPTCNQHLSDFCKDLTGIQQIQVDRGVTLGEALLRHDKWLEKKGIKNTNFAVVTWSNWDCRVMLESECRYKKIRKPPYFNRWINLKVPFHEVFGGTRCNLKEAVEMAGLTWQGRAHCGLDDAKNTACLLALLMRKGFRFSITNSLMGQSTDDSFALKPPLECPSFASHQLQKVRDLHLAMPQISPFCHCGVKSSRGMVRKPGPKQGCLFFGCGKWTAATGARCLYFEWASP